MSNTRNKNMDLYYSHHDLSENNPDASKKMCEELEADPSESGIRYRQHKQTLIQLTENKIDKGDLNRQLIRFLKQLFLEALQDHGLPLDIKMELCIAGSLARGQANAYSDVDSFLIFDPSVDADTQKKVREVAQTLFFVADRYYTATRQFSFDAAGISLYNLSGEPMQLLKKLMHEEEKSQIISIIQGKPIFGNSALFDQLISLMKDVKSFKPYFTAEYYFDKAINDFTGPRKGSIEVNVKQDTMRPFDFILIGLKILNGDSRLTGESSGNLIKDLYVDGKIDFRTSQILAEIQERIYSLRKDTYNRMKGEHNKLEPSKDKASKNPKSDEPHEPDKPVTELIDQIGWLRANIENFVQSGMPLPFSLQPGMYLSRAQSSPTDNQVSSQVELLVKSTIRILSSHLADIEPNVKLDTLSLRSIYADLPTLQDRKLFLDLMNELNDSITNNDTSKISSHEKSLQEKLEKLKLPPNHGLPNIINDYKNRLDKITYQNVLNKAHALLKSETGKTRSAIRAVLTRCEKLDTMAAATIIGKMIQTFEQRDKLYTLGKRAAQHGSALLSKMKQMSSSTAQIFSSTPGLSEATAGDNKPKKPKDKTTHLQSNTSTQVHQQSSNSEKEESNPVEPRRPSLK